MRFQLVPTWKGTYLATGFCPALSIKPTLSSSSLLALTQKANVYFTPALNLLFGSIMLPLYLEKPVIRKDSMVVLLLLILNTLPIVLSIYSSQSPVSFVAGRYNNVYTPFVLNVEARLFLLFS